MFNKTSNAYVTDSVQATVNACIEQSINQNCTVEILADYDDSQSLETILNMICSDGTQNCSTLEFWGDMAGRGEWRIHVSPLQTDADEDGCEREWSEDC